MELLIRSLVFIHVLAGIITLLAGPLAIYYNFKQPKQHRLAGKVFFYAMLVVAISSIITFFRHPEVLFYQFLLGIALIVLAGTVRGVRAMMLMKGGKVLPFDFYYTILLAVTSMVMLGKAALLFTQGGNIAFPILFTVFGVGAAHDSIKNFRIFRAPQQLAPTDWLQLHLGSMLGAFIASTTAFTVNTAHYLPWFVQWFGPTVLLVPVIIYFERKVKRPVVAVG